jgi:hypothetical protein
MLQYYKHGKRLNNPDFTVDGRILYRTVEIDTEPDDVQPGIPIKDMIADAIRTRNAKMLRVFIRARRTTMQYLASSAIFTNPSSGVDEDDVFHVYYMDTAEIQGRGKYNKEPHVFAFGTGYSYGGRGQGEEGGKMTKLEAMYANSPWPMKKMENGHAILHIPRGEGDECVFALFYRIVSDVSKFSPSKFPIYQVVSQNKVLFSEILAGPTAFTMFTGASNNSIRISTDARLTDDYETFMDATLVVSRTPLSADELARVDKKPTHDKNHAKVAMQKRANNAVIFAINEMISRDAPRQQSLVCQTGCGILDTCALPLITYAALPTISEAFLETSEARAQGILGVSFSRVNGCMRNEFLAVFLTNAVTDLMYLQDKLYGETDDDMRSIRGVNSGDCEDSAFCIYQTVMSGLMNRTQNKVMQFVNSRYVAGICVMSVKTKSGHTILHQVCVLFPRNLYAKMQSFGRVDEYADVDEGLGPILLDGTVKSLSSYCFDVNMERYASAVAVIGSEGKFSAYQANVASILPDNPHARYATFISFVTGDAADKSKFRYLRFADGDSLADGVPYKKVLARKGFQFVDVDVSWMKFPDIVEKYNAEMVAAAKTVFPVPDVLADGEQSMPFDGSDALDGKYAEIVEKRNVPFKEDEEESGAAEAFNRVVFSLKQAHFVDDVDHDIERICSIKCASYSLKKIAFFPTDYSLDVILVF